MDEIYILIDSWCGEIQRALNKFDLKKALEKNGEKHCSGFKDRSVRAFAFPSFREIKLEDIEITIKGIDQ